MGKLVTFRIDGLKVLDQALGEFKASTAKNILRRVGRTALEPLDAAWRARAPHLTGALEASGGVGSKLTRSQREAQERESFVEVFAGPGPNPQAIQQEFGNATQPPQPYFRPAWEETRDQVLEGVVQGLGEEILKTARRVGRRSGGG